MRSYFEVSEDTKKEVLTSSMAFTAIWTLLILAFLLVSTFLMGGILGEGQQILLVLAFCTSVLDVNSRIPLILLRSQRKTRSYVSFTLTRFLLGILLNIVFVAFLDRGVRGIFEAGLIASAVTFSIVLAVVSRNIIRRFSLHHLRGLLAYSLPLIPASLATWVTLYSDRLFLQIFRDGAEVGLYNLGYNIGFVFRFILIGPISLAWAPVAYAAFSNRENATRLYSRALTYYAAISSFVCLGFILLPGLLLLILSTPSFYPASEVVPIVALSYLMHGSCIVLGTGIRLVKKTKYFAMIYISAALENLLLNYLLIPGYGMMGAAIATFVSYFSIAMATYLVSNRCLKVEYEWPRVFKIFFAGTIITVTGLYFQTSSVFIEAAGRVLLILTFPVILLVLRFYTVDEKKQIKRILKSPLEFVKEIR
jgi:O-antigen/teichoic acid export membrane protein